MRYTLLFFLTFIFCCAGNNTLFSQEKKRKKIKPVYHGKLQGGYFIDKVVPKGASEFTYLNFGIRKVTGEKMVERGIETFYYQNIFDKKIVNDFFSTGTKQTGFGLNYYHYIMLKKWNFKKFHLQVGPQFSFGYYHKENQPLSQNNFAKTFNDFKIGAAARVELNYRIDGRYAAILGSQYTISQFGLRRTNFKNPGLDIRSQLDDYLQFDFLPQRFVAYFGILRQFGRVKIDRVKLKEKRAKAKQQKQEKAARKLAKRQKKKDKTKTKKQKEKERNEKKRKKKK